MNILIVDDNDQNLYMQRTLLEGCGHKVVSAVNGEEALDIARQNPPDMVISDILMPVMDGFALCREWKSDDLLKKIPFVFYTATYTDKKDEELALEEGASRFIRMPVEPDEFIKIIENIISKPQRSTIRRVNSSDQKDVKILRLYNERLIRKLEKKMLDLEEERAERAKITDALRKSEDKFSKAFRSSPTLISISTLEEGLFREVNDAFIHHSGYSKKEIIGNTSMNLGLWHQPADLDKIVSQLRNQGAVYNHEIQFRTKTGGILIMLYSAELIDMEGQECVLSVALDITERKKLERQLLHAQKMESIGTLAGGVAHDFNNILTAIIGFASVLNRKIPEDNPLKVYVDQILAAADNAANLTSSLLTFSRKQKINLDTVDLNKTIKKMEKFLLRIIGEDIEFRILLTHDNLNVMADFSLMEQVLMNIIANARDAMPHGGLLTIRTESVTINDEFIKTCGFGTPGTYASISISDTGVGIDEKTREKIFEPFFTTKEVDKGTGLGLSIVYGIIKQHGGYLNVLSEPGKGSVFQIYLPLIRQSAGKKSLIKHDVSKAKGGTETILVAEDDEMIRKLITAVLEEFGYKVISAENGEIAIDRFIENKNAIQFVILDVIMPKRNGIEVYENIKKIRPDLKYLFLSGYSEDIIQDKDLIKKETNFISKPIKPDYLLCKVRELLDVKG